jgi:hypothetical protein
MISLWSIMYFRTYMEYRFKIIGFFNLTFSLYREDTDFIYILWKYACSMYKIDSFCGMVDGCSL